MSPQPATGRRRGRGLGWILFVAFVVVPVLEIYVLIQVGQVIGGGWTVLLLIADSIIGAWVVRHEGSRAWRALRTALQSGRMPATEIADGALILIGGTLMLTPGFVTDGAGLLLLLPVTRPLFRRALTGFVAQRLVVMGTGAGRTDGPTRGAPGAPGDARRPGPRSEGPVVRGEVVDDPDEDR